MTAFGDYLVVFGVLAVLSSGLLYVFALSRFKKSIKSSGKNELFELGLDTSTDLFGPQFGSREAQQFFLKKQFLKHPDQAVVGSGKLIYRSMLMLCGALSAIGLGMLMRTVGG